MLLVEHDTRRGCSPPGTGGVDAPSRNAAKPPLKARPGWSVRRNSSCERPPEGVNELAGERLNSPPKLGGVPARPSSSTKGRAGGVVPKQVVARFYLGTTPSPLL